MPKSDKDRIVAHRGSPRDVPGYESRIQNSEEAFTYALGSIGVKAVECDVFPTIDNEIVVFHDETLEHIGSVKAHKDCSAAQLEELKKLPIYRWKHTDLLKYARTKTKTAVGFREVPIMTLKELLRLVKQYPGAKIFIEVKGTYYSENHQWAGVAKDMPRLIAETVRDAGFDASNIVIIGFNRELVMATNAALGGRASGALWLLCQATPTYRPSAQERENDRKLGYTYIDANQSRDIANWLNQQLATTSGLVTGVGFEYNLKENKIATFNETLKQLAELNRAKPWETFAWLWGHEDRPGLVVKLLQGTSLDWIATDFAGPVFKDLSGQ